MSRLHLMAFVAAGIAVFVAGVARRAEPQSEDRAVYLAYAGICGCAAVTFAGIAWWIAR